MDDGIWQVWNDLQRKEDDLAWGGHPPGIGMQYNSMGRPVGSHLHAGGGGMHEQMGRIERVRHALRESGRPGQRGIAHTLAGIDLSPVWSVLVSACQDIALCYGSSVTGGGFIGGAGGPFFGCVGTLPGLAMIATASSYMNGGWVTALLGLPSLAEGLAPRLPEAAHCYASGFIEAWGPTRLDQWHGAAMQAGGDLAVAAFHFANGHAVMVTAILAALVAYLTKDKGAKAVLLAEISHSPRLGPKVAAWVEKNEAELSRHPALRSRGWSAADEESAPMRPRQTSATHTGCSVPRPSSSATPDGVAPSEQELADMDKMAGEGMAEVLAHGERFVSTARDPRQWPVVAHGGELSPNPGGPDYPAGVLEKGEDYTKQIYTEGNRSFPVVQTARGVYSYPSANAQPVLQQIIGSGKEARAALLAADAAAQKAAVAEINADLQNYIAQVANEAAQSSGGWADSRQPDAPLIDFRQKLASNTAVVNNLMSTDGWSAVGALMKDTLRNAGGINGPGFDVRSGPVVTATAQQQDAAVETLFSVPVFFEHELAFSSVVAPVSVGGGNTSGLIAQSPEIATFDAFGRPISQRTQCILGNFSNAKKLVVTDDAGRQSIVSIVDGLGRNSVKVNDLGKLQAATGNEFSLLRGPDGKRVLLQGQMNELAIPYKYIDNGFIWSGHSHPFSTIASEADRSVLRAFGQEQSVIKSAATGKSSTFTKFEDLSNWLPGQ